MTKGTIGILGVLAAGAVFSAQVAIGRPVPAGILVGVHHLEDQIIDQGHSRPAGATLRTIWLESERTSADTIPLLLVPRKSGFWWMGLTHSCAEEPHESVDVTRQGDEIYIEDAVWASPARAQSLADIRKAEIASGGECQSTDVICVVDSRTHIYWVWPDFISMNRGTTAECGAHPDASFNYTIRRLDDLEKRLAVADVFDSGAEARLRTAFERAKGDLDKDCADLATFYPTSWYVERTRGHWTLKGWSDTHRLCGVGIDYSTTIDLSRISGRVSPPPAAWMSVSNIKDAMASPDGRWVLLVRESEIVLVARGALDRPVARSLLSSDDSIVMVEWAQGASVARWRNQVRRLAAQ